MKKIRKSLKELATIRTGLYATPDEKGAAIYIQAKQFDNWGNTIAMPEAFLDISPKTEGHLLKDGDVLFASKGFRFFATTYREIQGPAIASSLFFVIRPNQDVVQSEYLTTYLNLPQSNEYFKQLSAGSSIPSIRISELMEFKVELPSPEDPKTSIVLQLPSLEKQKQIVAYAELHRQEIQCLETLIENKKKLYSAIMSTLLKSKPV